MFEALGGAKIKKVHYPKYKMTDEEDDKRAEVKFGDIQSEEEKDILFVLEVPTIHEEPDSMPLVKITLNYFNVITGNENETITSVAFIRRPAHVDPTTQRNDFVNYNLDRQHNRIIAAEAMDNATNLANGGNLAQAKLTLDAAMERIRGSVSSGDPFCVGLIGDLEHCKRGLRDTSTWSSTGSKWMNNSVRAHYQQRSSNVNNVSQAMYSTPQQAQMKSLAVIQQQPQPQSYHHHPYQQQQQQLQQQQWQQRPQPCTRQNNSRTHQQQQQQQQQQQMMTPQPLLMQKQQQQQQQRVSASPQQPPQQQPPRM